MRVLTTLPMMTKIECELIMFSQKKSGSRGEDNLPKILRLSFARTQFSDLYNGVNYHLSNLFKKM